MSTAADTERDDLLAPDLMARVRQIQIRMHRLVNDVLSGAYRSTFRGSGVEFEEVRKYLPGDDVRNIDWNRTARAGEPFVKTYVEERELSLQFLVDTSPSMDFGSDEFTKRETAALFCALLSYVALRHHDQVGLTLFGDTPGLHLPLRKGAGAVARVVREVIAARPTKGGADFAAVLDHQAKTLRRRAFVFLISDFLPSANRSAEWVDSLAGLAGRHDVVAVRTVDRFEENLSDAGWITMRDVESGNLLDLDTRSAKVREEWAAAAAARDEELRGYLRRAGVDSIDLFTTGDVADPVVRFFRQRRRRRGRRAGGAANGAPPARGSS